MNEINEIKITETVDKQSGCSSWNPKNKQTNKNGSDSPHTHTHTNSTLDISENITVKFEWSSPGICMLRVLPSPGTALSQAFSVNSLRWRIRDAWTTWPEILWPRGIMRSRTRQGTVNTVIFLRKELYLSVFTHFFFPGPILSWWHYTFAPLWLVHHIPIQTV